MKFLFVMLMFYSGNTLALDCRRTEFPFSKKVEDLPARKELMNLERQQLFEYLLFEVTHKTGNPKLADDLAFILENSDPNPDMRVFVKIIRYASELTKTNIKTISLKEVCDLHKRTIGKSAD